MAPSSLLAILTKPLPPTTEEPFDPDDETCARFAAQLRRDLDARANGRRALRLMPRDVALLTDANARALAALASLTE